MPTAHDAGQRWQRRPAPDVVVDVAGRRSTLVRCSMPPWKTGGIRICTELAVAGQVLNRCPNGTDRALVLLLERLCSAQRRPKP